MFSKPRGTRDILPEEMKARREVEKSICTTFEKFGYQEIQTPIFEDLKLITAKSGEEIKDHLYAFQDKSGRWLALRPELSAPTIRLYVNELRNKPKPQKLYYMENCFRYERPQKGRYREFWQAGIELIGTSKPEAEAEVVALAVKCLENLGLKDYRLSIGHIGILRAYLSENSINEKVQNQIIGFIDKKDINALERMQLPSSVKKTISALTKIKGTKNEVFKEIKEKLDKKALNEFERFTDFMDVLEKYGVKDYTVDLGIARGLDYYTGMVFEIYAEGLGAQNQICGGGSYNLIKLFGGGDQPSCGFGFGFDRLMLALEAHNLTPKLTSIPQIFIIPSSRKVLNKAIRISKILRNDIACDLELMGRKLDKSLSYADSIGIPYVVIVNDDSVVLRDMGTGEQRTVQVQEIKDAVG